MEKKQLGVHVRIQGGHLISKKNIRKIFAKSVRPDRTHHGFEHIEPGNYYETWIVSQEPEGFIFREINHYGGINGHHATLRCLILHTLFSSHLQIFIGDEGELLNEYYKEHGKQIEVQRRIKRTA